MYMDGHKYCILNHLYFLCTVHVQCTCIYNCALYVTQCTCIRSVPVVFIAECLVAIAMY